MVRRRQPHGRWGRGLPLLAAVLLVLVVTVAALAGQEPAGPEGTAALPHLAGEPRHFYITATNATPDAALESCAAGYHMASLWEIVDPTTLVYASNLAGAKTRGDQGTGPVAGWWGWVRTGGDSYAGNVAGRANCTGWTTDAGGQYGTLARLAETWTASAEVISPWQAQTWSCGGTAPVWCVSDTVYGAYLPVLMDGG